MPTKAESDYMDEVAQLGCIACQKLGYMDTPAEIHHVSKGVGKGQRASNYDVIPLCPYHHRLGGYGQAIHAGRKEWEKNFGDELELLKEVKVMVVAHV